MNPLLLARAGLSCLCIIQAAATAAIDFNRTHATNPLWTGHARFHVVWQSSTICLLSIMELFLIWSSGQSAASRFYLAEFLAALSPLGFLAACATRKLFRGTLSDPNGIPPLRLRLLGAVRKIDMNLAAVVAALLSLVALAMLYPG